jgi:hypothetical protein
MKKETVIRFGTLCMVGVFTVLLCHSAALGIDLNQWQRYCCLLAAQKL